MHSKYVTALLITVGLGLGTFATVDNSVSVHAATWHKGAPKVARGMWSDKYKYPKGAMYDTLYISKSRLVENDNDPRLTHLKYKKVGTRRYKFRGYEFELGKNITTPTFHFISKHHVRYTQYHHTTNLYK